MSVRTARQGTASAAWSGVEQKRCIRCATAVTENDLCPACRKFFLVMSKRKVALVTEVRSTKRHQSVMSGK
jgi:hypothetical protein